MYRKASIAKENYLMQIIKEYTSPSGVRVCTGSRLFYSKFHAFRLRRSGLAIRVDERLGSVFVTEQEVLYSTED